MRSAITRDLESQLADVLTSDPDRVYPTMQPPRADIPVPDDLVGHVSEDPFTFELTGTMPVDRTFVWRADAEAEAIEAFLADEGAVPPNTTLAEDTIEVDIGEAAPDGETIVVQTTVTADAVPDLDQENIRRALVGMTAAEARQALAPIGPADVRPVAGLGRPHPAPGLAHQRQRRAGGRRSVTRLIGLDHGSRRIGVAIGDTDTGMAFARPALRRQNTAADIDAIAQMARDEEAATIVLGLPRNMDGSEGVQAAAARKFGERLAATGLAIDFQDERLTSWQALEQMGPRRGRDRRSGELDSAAARLILQEYLDAGSRPRFPQEAE